MTPPVNVLTPGAPPYVSGETERRIKVPLLTRRAVLAVGPSVIEPANEPPAVMLSVAVPLPESLLVITARFVFELALPESALTLRFFPLRSTVAPAPMVRFAAPNAVVLPATSVPADAVVVPVYELLPLKVTVPTFVVVTPPVPLMLPPKT